MTGSLFDLADVPTAPKGSVDPMLRAQRSAAIDAERTLARRDHRDTAKAAAAKALGRSGSARRRVFDLLAVNEHGLTDEQICEALRLNPSTERPRRVELVDAGFVVDTGERRRVASGGMAAVWGLTTSGREAAA